MLNEGTTGFWHGAVFFVFKQEPQVFQRYGHAAEQLLEWRPETVGHQQLQDDPSQSAPRSLRHPVPLWSHGRLQCKLREEIIFLLLHL